MQFPRGKLPLACLAVLLVTAASPVWLVGVAAADNSLDGDNKGDSDQSGESASGDAIAGQAVGIVVGGDIRANATNRSKGVDVESGGSSGSNRATRFVGQVSIEGQEAEETGVSTADVGVSQSFENLVEQINEATILSGSATAANTQSGDNQSHLSQTADAASGDGVGGQVIGVVTPTGGSADIVADNTSEDVSVSTGDADSTNRSDDFVGLLAQATSGDTITIVFQRNLAEFTDSSFNTLTQSNTATVTGSTTAANTQTGDNLLEVAQTTDASSGDGVGGQIVGVVSAGDTSIDAANRSTDADISTGDTESTNDSGSSAGLLTQISSGDTTIIQRNDADFENSDFNAVTQSNTATVTGSTAANTQDGDNDLEAAQTADASSGDGVGGQIIGVVTSAAGSADIVADNTSEDIRISTGDAESANDSDASAGLLTPATSSDTTVVQENAAAFEDSDNNTVAQANSVTVTGSAAANTQDGDNDLEAAQTTDASSGDGVGGQVVGVVTAGDTAIDATNRSSDVDVITGDATSANDSDTFAGLLGGDAVTAITQSNEVALTDSDDNTVTQTNTATVTDVTAANVQDGDNQTRLTQTADASSGDGVGGQIIGAVTSARGSADVDMANTSTDLDVQTGETGRTNFAVLFVGLVTGNAGAGP